MQTMLATVFHGVNDFRIDSVPKPPAGPGEAVLRITATTICGTDLHIVGESWLSTPRACLASEATEFIEGRRL